MARKNPIKTITDVALGTAETAASLTVETAKGGVGLGRLVAGAMAAKASETVTALLPGRTPVATPPAAAPRGTAAESLPAAVPAEVSRKVQGDALAPETAARVAPTKAPAQKAPAKKTAAKKTPAQKTPAQKTPAKKSAAKKVAAPKVEVDPSTPVNVTEELGLDPSPVAKKAPAKKAPAKKAPAKAPAKKAAAKKTPAKKAPAKKSPAKKAASPSAEPLTDIDKQADTEHVDVTPADIAPVVAKKSAEG
ncbi:hypothetical protein [Nocardioides sp. cx-173]|uniref:hypothetical protein n=1 Tax=Nocardioides sp. cx-173 TaxID=2898796 RepID=UPI001E28FDB4|nr:hypothetical protein [Nocardioides sp. cx-173]MCD4525797.1 hypothetical protein [Nocardioides sp. cx-173]UGB39953.1 hypothetical protein LQ940_11115 [Nocardioides sp. cx-173]